MAGILLQRAPMEGEDTLGPVVDILAAVGALDLRPGQDQLQPLGHGAVLGDLEGVEGDGLLAEGGAEGGAEMGVCVHAAQAWGGGGGTSD